MIIKVDLDGVIVTEEKTFERSLAQPLEDARQTLKRLKDLGHTILIETARGWQEYRMTVDQLVRYGIQYDQLIMGKPIADIVIDDRAIRFKTWRQVELALLNKDEDAFAVYKVRQATAEFLKGLTCTGVVLEISPMVQDEMPFPEFYVRPREYAETYTYCGNDAPTKDFFTLNSVSPKLDHVIAVNVLEHMEQVWKFPSHCKHLLNKGGQVHIFVPYNLRFHGPKPDLWRFTDTGLNYLMKDFKLLKMETYGPSTKPYGLGASYEA